MPKVSVVVPVYGVEKYIEQCARSLFEQTLDDIEFIFVDDCTPDQSIEILKRVIDEYRDEIEGKRYVVRIEKMPTNSGLAAVRRHGIQFCSGEYIIHCDSDDWVDKTMYEKLYYSAVEKDSDVAVCDFLRVGEAGSSIILGAHSLDMQSFLLDCLFQKDPWSLCNKLFRRAAYYEGLHFPKAALGEDMVICLQLLQRCTCMAYIREPLYYYRFNTMSITRKKTVENCVNNYYALKENTDFIISFINDSIPMKNNMRRQVVSYLRMVNSFVLLGIKHLSQYKDLWKKNLQRMPLSFFFNKRITLYKKVSYCLSILPFYPFEKDRVVCEE